MMRSKSSLLLYIVIIIIIIISWMTSSCVGGAEVNERLTGAATFGTSHVFITTVIVGVGSLLGFLLLLICCVHKKIVRRERENEQHGKKSSLNTQISTTRQIQSQDEAGRTTDQPNGPHSKSSSSSAAAVAATTRKDVIAANGTGRLQALLESHGSETSIEEADDDEEIEVVPLTSWDETGLGFDVTGNLNDGILVKNVHSSGPAKQSGRMNYGDRIVSLAISMRQMTLKDAEALLEIASRYPIELHITKSPPDVVVHALTPKSAKMISGQSKSGEPTSGLDFLSTEKRSKSADCLTTVENEDSMMRSVRHFSIGDLMRSGRHYSVGDLPIFGEMSSSKRYGDEMMDLEKRVSSSDSSSDVVVVISDFPTDLQKATEVGNRWETTSQVHDNLAFNWNDENPVDLEEENRKYRRDCVENGRASHGTTIGDLEHHSRGLNLTPETFHDEIYRTSNENLEEKKISYEATPGHDDSFFHSKPQFDSDWNFDLSEFNIDEGRKDRDSDHLQFDRSENMGIDERKLLDDERRDAKGSSLDLEFSGEWKGTTAAGRYIEKNTTGKDLSKDPDQKDFEKEFFQFGKGHSLPGQSVEQKFEQTLDLTEEKTMEEGAVDSKQKQMMFPVCDQNIAVSLTSRAAAAAAGREDPTKSSRMEKKTSGDVSPKIITQMQATLAFDEAAGTKQKKTGSLLGGKIKSFFNLKKGGVKAKEEPPKNVSSETPNCSIHREITVSAADTEPRSSIKAEAGEEIVGLYERVNDSSPTAIAGAITGIHQEDGLMMMGGKKMFDVVEGDGIGIHASGPSEDDLEEMMIISQDRIVMKERLDERRSESQVNKDKDPKTKEEVNAIVEFKAPPRKRGSTAAAAAAAAEAAAALTKTDHMKLVSDGDPGQEFLFDLKNENGNQRINENDQVNQISFLLDASGNHLNVKDDAADKDDISKIKILTVFPEKKNIEEEEEDNSASKMYKVNDTVINCHQHNDLQHHHHHNMAEEKQKAMSLSLDCDDRLTAMINENENESDSTTSNDTRLPSSVPHSLLSLPLFTSNVPDSLEPDLNRFKMDPVELPSPRDSLCFSIDNDNMEQSLKRSVLNVELGGGKSASDSGSSLPDKKTRKLFLIRSGKKSDGDANNNNFEMSNSNA